MPLSYQWPVQELQYLNLSVREQQNKEEFLVDYPAQYKMATDEEKSKKKKKKIEEKED